MVFGAVLDLPESQGRTPEASRQDEFVTHSHVEVGMMDFIMKLPMTTCGVDYIWVIVDRLTKSAHFISIAESISTEKLANVYIRPVVVRHRVLVSMIPDRDVRSTSRIWRDFHEELGTHLLFGTTYHPQTKGQSDKTVHTLEDMIRACVLDFIGAVILIF